MRGNERAWLYEEHLSGDNPILFLFAYSSGKLSRFFFKSFLTNQVTVLGPSNPSTSDKDQPRFLHPLAEESIVVEGHCYELQTRLTGTAWQ